MSKLNQTQLVYDHSCPLSGHYCFIKQDEVRFDILKCVKKSTVYDIELNSFVNSSKAIFPKYCFSVLVLLKVDLTFSNRWNTNCIQSSIRWLLQSQRRNGRGLGTFRGWPVVRAEPIFRMFFNISEPTWFDRQTRTCGEHSSPWMLRLPWPRVSRALHVLIQRISIFHYIPRTFF